MSLRDLSKQTSKSCKKNHRGRPHYDVDHKDTLNNQWGCGSNFANCCQISCPEIKWPEYRCPEIKWPEYRCPEIRCPEIRCPEVRCPEWRQVNCCQQFQVPVWDNCCQWGFDQPRRIGKDSYHKKIVNKK